MGRQKAEATVAQRTFKARTRHDYATLGTKTALGEGAVLITGRIRCIGGIVVSVFKVINVVGGDRSNPLVQTTAYSYNAYLEGIGNIVRYDSPHSEEHRPAHHVHRYDVLRGDLVGTVADVAEDAWPTIGDLLTELQDFYHGNCESLSGR